MNIPAIVFGTLSIVSLVTMIIVLFLPTEKLQSCKLFNWIQPEVFMSIGLVCFISFAIIFGVCLCNRCDNCNRIVMSAYCNQCGAKNENFEDRVVNTTNYNICPNCQEIRYTPYCGDCGTKIYNNADEE